MADFSKSGPTQWDKEIIKKYGDTASLYTSYPDQTQFNENYTQKNFESALSEIKGKTFEPLSLYVHIPFCEDICYYCACTKVVTRNKQEADIYIDHLEKEMRLLNEHLGRQRRVTQLYIGGGSPTFLDAGQLTRLIHTVSRYFLLTDHASREYTIEIDPRTTTIDNLALLKGLGINQLSVGIQDFTPDVQKAINRISNEQEVKKLINAARDYEFSIINTDLIYGLPNQTPENLTDTINKIIALNPDRITFYPYHHLPDQFKSQRAIDQSTLPSPEQQLDILNSAAKQLFESGYHLIGMGLYVKASDPLFLAQQKETLTRNFHGYTANRSTDVIGVGISAISCGENFYCLNTDNLETYYQNIHCGKLPIYKGLQCSNDDLKRRAVIMSLICNFSLNIHDWERHFSTSFNDYFSQELQQLKVFTDDGLIKISSSSIEVLPKGRPIISYICTIFDLYHNPLSENLFKVI